MYVQKYNLTINTLTTHWRSNTTSAAGVVVSYKIPILATRVRFPGAHVGRYLLFVSKNEAHAPDAWVCYTGLQNHHSVKIRFHVLFIFIYFFFV